MSNVNGITSRNVTYVSPSTSIIEVTYEKQKAVENDGRIAKPDYNKRFDISDFKYKGTHSPISLETRKPDVTPDDPNIIDNHDDYFGVKPDGSNVINGIIITDIEYKVGGYMPDGKPYFIEANPSYNSEIDKTKTDKYFFSASTDFLTKSAEKYAKIGENQDFKYRPTKDDNFINSLVGFFYDGKATQEQYKQLRSEIDTAVRELANIIKNGGDTDITKLKSTITIAGEKVTFKQIKDIQEQSQKMTDGLTGVGSGSDDVVNMAKKGLSKGMGMAYGDSLGGKLGESYKKAFARGIDNNLRACLKFGSKNYDKYAEARMTAEFGEKAYNIFGNVRNSSDFKSAMKKFDNVIDDYNKAWGGGIGGRYLADMKKDLENAFNAFR